MDGLRLCHCIPWESLRGLVQTYSEQMRVDRDTPERRLVKSSTRLQNDE